MYDPMPTTDIALLLRHGMLHKKSVASVTKYLTTTELTTFTKYGTIAVTIHVEVIVIVLMTNLSTNIE